MTIQLELVGHVQGVTVLENIDDDWGAVESVIALDPARYGPEALKGLDAFSHVLVVFVFDRIEHAAIATGARRPRGNPDWPEVGVFAQRGSPRPNRPGQVTRGGGCRRVRWAEADGAWARRARWIAGARHQAGDAGLRAARRGIREPHWARAIMAQYW